MSIYRLSPEESLITNLDHDHLRNKYEALANRCHDLEQFILELLRRHPEELLAYAMYNEQREPAQQRSASTRAKRIRQGAKPVVYYLDRVDRVKIGMTTSITGRLASLQALPDDLLAVEPGGRSREFDQHLRFQHLRIGRTEWFIKGADLMEYIATLRRATPDPYGEALRVNRLAPRG